MRKSMYVKLVVSFIAVFTLSNLVASLMSYYGSELNNLENLERVLEENLNQINTLDELLLAETITPYNYIVVKRLESLDQLRLDVQTIKDINLEQTVTLFSDEYQSEGTKTPLSIKKIDNTYAVAYPIFENLGFSSRSLIMQINLRSLIIGSFLFVIITGLLLKPIKKLIEGTKKIANGNYGVMIESKRDDEIGELIKNFNEMSEKLASVELFRNDFISDISHEFRTPLTSIEGYVSLLENSKEDEKLEYISIIKDETQRLSELSSSILLLNSLENQKEILDFQMIQYDELIRKSILLLEPKWSKKNIEMFISLKVANIKGDGTLLSQLVINLLDNAIKFTPDFKEISIELTSINDVSILSVKDSGPGMSKDALSRIFDKFFKGDTSRSLQGNGLGMSIVKKIVDLHHGTIEIKSEVNEGFEVIIKI